VLTITLAWVRGCDCECGPYPRTVLTVLGNCQDNKLTINKQKNYGCCQYSPKHWHEAKAAADAEYVVVVVAVVVPVAVVVTDQFLYLYLYPYPFPYPFL